VFKFHACLSLNSDSELNFELLLLCFNLFYHLDLTGWLVNSPLKQCSASKSSVHYECYFLAKLNRQIPSVLPTWSWTLQPNSFENFNFSHLGLKLFYIDTRHLLLHLYLYYLVFFIAFSFDFIVRSGSFAPLCRGYGLVSHVE